MGSGLLRAAHVREDPPPWVFEDALAGQLLDAAEAAELEAEMAAWPPVVRRALRVSHAVRVRLAEDVAAGLAAGRRHYVLLGAGLDTFAWRHPRAGEFVVWEIDHPDTRAWKRAALRRAGLAEPANVRFVAADLSATAKFGPGTRPRSPPFEERLQLAFVEPADRYDESAHSIRALVGGAGAPRRAQQSNTDQQMSFRNRWSSRTSSRIASGSWSRCHRHSSRPASSASSSGAPARAALIA